jgi:hypothetical protein
MVLQATIGLCAPDQIPLNRAGKPIPKPIEVPALIDPGCDRTAIASRLVRQLALAPLIYGTSQTAAGAFQVNLYRVDLTISKPSHPSGPVLIVSDLLVSEFTAPLPFDVLIGIDVLRECLLVLDGPGQQFILAF